MMQSNISKFKPILKLKIIECVKQKKRLSLRVSRLDEKSLELFSKHSAVKRYVAINHLRSHYLNEIRDTERSIESMVCRFVESDCANLALELECIP